MNKKLVAGFARMASILFILSYVHDPHLFDFTKTFLLSISIAGLWQTANYLEAQ